MYTRTSVTPLERRNLEAASPCVWPRISAGARGWRRGRAAPPWSPPARWSRGCRGPRAGHQLRHLLSHGSAGTGEKWGKEENMRLSTISETKSAQCFKSLFLLCANVRLDMIRVQRQCDGSITGYHETFTRCGVSVLATCRHVPRVRAG